MGKREGAKERAGFCPSARPRPFAAGASKSCAAKNCFSSRFPRPDPPEPVRRLANPKVLAHFPDPVKQVQPQIGRGDTTSVMAAMGKAGAVGARENWLFRSASKSVTWAPSRYHREKNHELGDELGSLRQIPPHAGGAD